MTVLEMLAGRAFQLQSRMMKPYSRSSNSGLGHPYPVSHLVLNSEEWALTISCATFFTCSRIKSWLTNPSVQITLTHAMKFLKCCAATCGWQWTRCSQRMVLRRSVIAPWWLCQQAELANSGKRNISEHSSLHSPKIMLWIAVSFKGIIVALFRD